MELKKLSTKNNYLILRHLIILISILLNYENIFSQESELFKSDEPLQMVLKYEVRELNKNRKEKSIYHNAILKVGMDSLNNKVYNIKIKTRGIYRLKSSNCYFPPLKIKFNEKDVNGTIFSPNEKLKLVLPCQKHKRYEQYVLLEYLAYKIYNILTDYSFKVRLIRLKLEDLENKKPNFESYAFVIEPTKSLAKRNNAKELEVKNIHPNQTDYSLMNRLALFQYLIGNTDWSVKALHNIKLLSRDSLQKPVAVPYDFDFSGLVNTTYSSPPEHLPINSVRQRHYNGYERTLPELKDNILIFKQKKEEIYELIYSLESLEKRYIDETIEYFDQFYQMLDNTKIIEHEFIEKSRK